MRYYGSRLSDNIAKTPEGFLICQNVPLARTGTQEYMASEIEREGQGMVTVHREPEEVFAIETIASFEGRPVTNDHPHEQLETNNVNQYQRGHVQNVRKGTGEFSDCLIGDLFITHPDLIHAVENGKREVSCGYECKYEEEKGKIYQRAIRGNHVAVVDQGRAGSRVAIKDHKPNTERRTIMKGNKKGIKGALLKAFARDAEPEELAEAADMLNEQEEQDNLPVQPEPEKETTDNDMISLLKQILAAVTQAPATDSEPEEEAMDELEQELEAADEGAELIEPSGTEDEEAEEQEDEEAEEETKANDSKAVIDAMAALRPTLAKLPKQQQKMMADAMTAQIRKAKGMSEKGKNQVADLKKAMKAKAFDTKQQVNEGDIGKNIMAARNPHYKK